MKELYIAIEETANIDIIRKDIKDSKEETITLNIKIDDKAAQVIPDIISNKIIKILVVKSNIFYQNTINIFSTAVEEGICNLEVL